MIYKQLIHHFLSQAEESGLFLTGAAAFATLVFALRRSALRS